MNSGKIFWFDTETTGLDPKQNAMIQLAGIVEVNGEVVDEFEILFRPWKNAILDDRALEINGRSVKELMTFPTLDIGVLGLKKKFDRWVSKYDKEDKFICAGYNVAFDKGFLREAFYRCGDLYGIGSYCFNCSLDIWALVSLAILHDNLRLPNYKLTTLCDYYKIKLKDAHDAIADIAATRELFLLLRKKYLLV